MAHVQKFTRGNLNGLSIHVDRKTENHANKDINPERTHLNQDLCQKEGDTLSRMHSRLKEVYCMKREDVKVAGSWIVTLPKSLKESSAADQHAFFESTYSFLTDRYDEENVLSAQIHLDESTPHMHFVFMPVIWDEKKKREKVSAKEVLTRLDLQTFHKQLDSFLKQDIPNIYQTGILNDETMGFDSVKELKKYTAEVNQKKEELVQDLELFKEPKTIFEAVDHSTKKNLFGTKVTLPVSEYEKLKSLSLSSIKLKNDREKEQAGTQKEIAALRTKLLDTTERLNGSRQETNEQREKVNKYVDMAEQAIETGTVFKENMIVYQSMLIEAQIPLKISETEKKGRLIVYQIETGRAPKTKKEGREWVKTLEENREQNLIEPNRLEKALTALKEMIEKIIERVQSYSRGR